MRWLLYGTSGLFFLTGVQIYMLSEQTESSFAWTVTPPIAAAALGGAYFAAAVAQFLAARRPAWATARVAVPWLGVFSPLVLAVTLAHLGEFHVSSADAVAQLAAWLWLATYAGTTAAVLLVTFVQLRTSGGDPPRSAPVPHSLHTSFLVETALLIIMGAVFLLAPGTAVKIVPYSMAPLTIQVIGAGLLSFAVFTFSASREDDLGRVRPVGGLLTVFAVLEFGALARYPGAVDWASPLTWIYVLFMASFLPAGVQAWFGPRLFRPESARSERMELVPAGVPQATARPSGITGVGSSADTTRGRPDMERPWYRQWPQGVPRSIVYPDLCVPELIEGGARRYPDRTAIRFYGATLSYRECNDAVDRFAAGLRRIGVRKGDRVSLPLLNTPHFVIAFYGVLRAGAIVVQTSPLYTPSELERLYNDAGVETVVTMDLFWHNLAKVKPTTPVKRAIVCDVAEFLRTPLRQLYPLQRRKNLKGAGHWPLQIPDEPWIHRFRDVLSAPPERGNEGAPQPDDVAILQYTGGTTGVPKGAMLTHRNLVANALQGSAWLGNRPGPDRVVGAIPGFHIYGLSGVLTFMSRGDELVLVPDPRDFGGILKLIQKTHATVFAGVPTLYTALLQHPKSERFDLSSLELCYSGGAPLPGEVRRKFLQRIRGRFVEVYGLSECSPALAGPATGPAREGIGFPQTDTDAIIVDPAEASTVLPAGEVGELALRGPQLMKGYWNQPEETALVLRDGWFLTGDMARMDADGIFSIVDRKKDMIDASGYKVYPNEVEDVLFSHPAIAEAAVIGVPDPYRGETVKAFVVLKAGVSATEQEILGFCKQRLAPYKVPRILEFSKELPKSLVGKVLRRELREREAARPRTAS